ncbi:TetR family transcriptional regulator C-terminal domain-containing protein [Brachybacterium sp. YJGR34]|uniref:TetR family transcriptional regulator C-terminal domain-containing protein n=1 Tax=Brachybacterium sp. YJGR34 TaxID=2059911 RepID=UPI000E0BE360|nr:TetR family transcriptional regulator C-terminal domain-containing protein [Brachybacterium sp. YJGR34]
MSTSKTPITGADGAEAPAATDAEAVRARVRSCIASSGLAQREFARRIELEESKLSKALGGTRRFGPEELVRIATVGGVTVNWLVSGSDAGSGPAAVPDAMSLPRRIRETPDQVRRRQEIVEAAWQLFASRGLHGVKITEIAAEAKVSTAAVYYYFDSKRELFEETLRYSVKLAFDRQVATLSLIEDPRERLEHLIGLQLPTGSAGAQEFSIWLQAWSEVSIGAGSQQNQAFAYQRWYRTVRDVLREGQEAGVYVDEPVEDLTTQLTSLIDGLGIKVLVGTLDVEQMRTQVHRFLARLEVDRP